MKTPIINFTHFMLNEAYTFFPKNENEIKQVLSGWPDNKVTEVITLFRILKKKHSSVATPINLDVKQSKVNISRALQGNVSIKSLAKEAGLKNITIKFGNGSSGNRGANNRGNLFEEEFADALVDWWNGEEVEASMLDAIKDLDKTYDLSADSENLTVEVVGGENTPRPIQFGSKIVLTNTKGSGNNIGNSVTDITLTTDTQTIYLSLKLGSTTTFFNVGIRKILTPEEIKSENITNKNGLKLLNLFGIDPKLFVDVFNGKLKKPVVDKSANYDKAGIAALLESGIGYGYHIIHKKGSKIHSKKMNKSAMKKSAKVGKIIVYYGGKTGSGKRVNVEFESSDYRFSINIRDTQGKDGYPTRMMCDFKDK